MDLGEPSIAQHALELADGGGASDAATERLFSFGERARKLGDGDHVRNGEAPARTKHPEGVAKDLLLVGGKVDDAVRDDDVGHAVGNGQVLNLAQTELDMIHLELVSVAPR